MLSVPRSGQAYVAIIIIMIIIFIFIFNTTSSITSKTPARICNKYWFGIHKAAGRVSHFPRDDTTTEIIIIKIKKNNMFVVLDNGVITGCGIYHHVPTGTPPVQACVCVCAIVIMINR